MANFLSPNIRCMDKYNLQNGRRNGLLKKTIALFCLLAIPFGFTACTQGEIGSLGKANTLGDIVNGIGGTSSPINVKKLDEYYNEGFINSVNDFAAKTSQVIFADKDTKNENVNYSPISLYFALSLLCTGTEGETNKEILDLLSLSSADGEDTNEYLLAESEKLFRYLYSSEKNKKLLIANSLWMSQNIKFKDLYKENAEKYFYSSLFNIDFADQKQVDKIGKWVSDNTNNLLNPTFKADPMNIMTIINTVYYKSTWIDKFDENANFKDLFHLVDNETVQCQFMNNYYSDSSYLQGENYVSTSLPMANGVMEFILPDKDVDVYSMIDTKEKMSKLINEVLDCDNLKSAHVDFSVPKYTIKTEIPLNNYLKSLGCDRMFLPDEQNNDFMPITDESVFISNVKQGTYMEVNEKGAEAAAYSSIEMNCTAALPQEKETKVIKLDRPFIYILRANNNTILFIGICNNPTVN